MIIFDNTLCENKENTFENDFNNLLEKIHNDDPSVVGLDIRGTLAPEQFASLFKALANNIKVENLILRGQNFNCDLSNEIIYSELTALLMNNKVINSLTLYHTTIQDKGIEAITNALGKNSALTYFKICGHNIDLGGQLSLVKMLLQNSTLKDFTLNYPSMAESAQVTLLSQSQNVFLKKLDIGGTFYQKFCAGTSQCEDTTAQISPLKDQKRDNPIAFALKQKELEISKLARFLEGAKFSQDSSKITIDFCYDSFLSAEKKLAEQYEDLKKEKSQRIKNERHDGAELKELNKYYDEAERDILEKYNVLQISTLDLFSKIWHKITSENREVEQVISDTLSQEKQVAKVSEDLPKPATTSTEAKIAPLIAKKLDINGELQSSKYLSEWTSKVSETDYEFVIISVGSSGKINQQIPTFSNDLGRVAILNIDQTYQDREMANISNSDNVSVNYLQSSIKSDNRFSLIPVEKRKQYEADRPSISQEELTNNINALNIAGKKVILLSHISLLAPRICFEKVLKNQDIMNNYGDKFLFMHSYFEECPTILCAKKFVEHMMEPNMTSRKVKEQYIYTDKEMPKGEELKDMIVSDSIQKLYYQTSLSFQDPNCVSVDDIYGDKVYKNLSLVEALDVISLMGNENIHLDYI